VKSYVSSEPYTEAGFGYVNVTQGTCNHVIGVSIYDLTSTWRAAAYYHHTENTISNGTDFDIDTSVGSLITTTVTLGNTADETGCSAWTGHHVHQFPESMTLRSYPDHSTCNRPNILTDCWVGAGYKQSDTNWSLNLP
jgi:hypothetical protein